MKEIKKHLHGITAAVLFFIGGTMILFLAGFTIPAPLPEEKAILMEFDESFFANASDANNSDDSKSDSEEKSNGAEKLLNQNVENSHYEESGSSEEKMSDAKSDKINGLFNNPFGDISGDNTNGENDNPHGKGDNLNPGQMMGKLDPGRNVTKIEPDFEDNLFGTVVFEITVNEKGNVIDVKLVNTTCNECVPAARDAVKKWKYESVSSAGMQIGTVFIEIKQN